MELNLIRKIAWSYNKTTKINFDDLFSEACIGYLEGQKRYDPSKGTKETTFLWDIMKSHLNSIIPNYQKFPKTEVNQMEPCSPLDLLLTKEKWDKQSVWKGSLSKEARMICKMIFESPHEFLVLNAPKLSRGAVKDRLREMGWSWEKIWSGFREIKNNLSQTGD